MYMYIYMCIKYPQTAVKDTQDIAFEWVTGLHLKKLLFFPGMKWCPHALLAGCSGTSWYPAGWGHPFCECRGPFGPDVIAILAKKHDSAQVLEIQDLARSWSSKTWYDMHWLKTHTHICGSWRNSYFMMTSCIHGQVPDRSLVPAIPPKKGKMDADDWKPGSLLSTSNCILF